MDKIICNSCQVEKDLSSFYKCKECRDGVSKVCKICALTKRRKGKEMKEEKIHPFNKEFRRSEESYYNMAGTTPKDYKDMWEILSLMGYNVEGDIHLQFINKMNQTLLKPLKYKKKKHITSFLPNGERNPKKIGIKKTPTE